MNTSKWDANTFHSSSVSVSNSSLVMNLNYDAHSGAGVTADSTITSDDWIIEGRGMRESGGHKIGEPSLYLGFTDKNSRDTTYYGDYNYHSFGNLYEYPGNNNRLEAQYDDQSAWGSTATEETWDDKWVRFTITYLHTDKKVKTRFVYGNEDVTIGLTSTATHQLSVLYPVIHFGSYQEYDENSYCDWYAIRKYASPEPTYTIGSEETGEVNNPPNKPTVNIPTNGATNQELTVTLNVTVTDPDGDSMNVSFWNNATGNQVGATQTSIANGSQATVSWSGLNYSTIYYWYANSTDGSLENKSDVWNFTTKGVSFSIVLTSPANETKTNDNTTDHIFNVSGSEPNYNCTVYYNHTSKGTNASTSNNTLTTITSSEISDGFYEWYVNCTTNSTTNQSEIREITVDTIAPAIILNTTASDENSFVDRNWSYQEAYSTENLNGSKLDWNGTNESATVSGMTCYLNKTNLADGNYTYKFWVNDSVGNWNSTSTYWTYIDTTNPTYSDNSTNSTLAGTNIEHSLKWSDNSLSGYIFSFCNGTWNGSDCVGGGAGQNTGATSPGTMADDNAVGTQEWRLVNQAKVSDDYYACTTLSTTGSIIKDENVKIVKSDGSIGTTNKANTTTWTDTEGYVSYGGSGDLWGESWSDTDINNANFGVVLQTWDAISLHSHYLKAT
ncbi:MAG: hypothetical protein KAW47_04525, partial [Thermoplasmatales archaeon]|nr:hypothetical protein [Thermoplasmatales archaeon]